MVAFGDTLVGAHVGERLGEGPGWPDTRPSAASPHGRPLGTDGHNRGRGRVRGDLPALSRGALPLLPGDSVRRPRGSGRSPERDGLGAAGAAGPPARDRAAAV